MSSGFSMIETVISLALSLVVSSTALSLVRPFGLAARTVPAVADVQQRARVAADTIGREVSASGSGAYSGPLSGLLGSLGVPPVLPRRVGALRPDGALTARADAITLLSVPATPMQTTLAAPVSAAALTLAVAAAPGCDAALVCGLSVGQDVLITDRESHFDVFRVTRVGGGTASLRHHGNQLSWGYSSGATVVTVVTRTFEFDAATASLRLYDGDLADQAAVDQLTGVTFSYWGDDPSGGRGVAPIALPTLGDGPWLGAGSSMFDADLLRVRSVRVAITAQAADPDVRAHVPPLRVMLQVAPRGLTAAR